MPVKHFAGTKDPETRVMRTPLCGYSVSGGVVTLTVSYVGFMALTNSLIFGSEFLYRSHRPKTGAF